MFFSFSDSLQRNIYPDLLKKFFHPQNDHVVIPAEPLVDQLQAEQAFPAMVGNKDIGPYVFRSLREDKGFGKYLID